MPPTEILNHIDHENRNLLYGREDFQNLTHEQVLALMNLAALRAFRFGGDSAMATLKSLLVIKAVKNGLLDSESTSNIA